ncbi:MAG: AAA-like domain-containing protein [Cyanobacteriota bacterium]|nr:AAA-like domain-containing protein [Cyanobacteriota bacterium]
MNQETFEDIYKKKLDAKHHEILPLFLQGKTDQQIADSLKNKVYKNRTSINRWITEIRGRFSETGELIDRWELVERFFQYKPELVTDECLKRYKFLPRNKEERPDQDEIYLERELLDSCHKKLLQVGTLLRIKAPKQWGKTLLVNRLLETARGEGDRTAYIDVLDADKESCENLDRFLQWFCRNVGRELGVAKEKLLELWDKDDDSKVNCNEYFEKAIFPEVEKSLVLAFDNIDRLFPCAIAEDILTMLRAWFEKTKREKKHWSKLRLVVAHSTECYVPMNANQSPFNVGETIALSEFSLEQISELMDRHEVSLKDGEIERLIETIGGHPFLVDRAIAFLKDNKNHPDVTLDEMLAKAATLEGIYGSHLRELWGDIQEREELIIAMKEVVSATESVALKLNLIHQLDGLGVVKLDGNKVMPRCNLYRCFFAEQLK